MPFLPVVAQIHVTQDVNNLFSFVCFLSSNCFTIVVFVDKNCILPIQLILSIIISADLKFHFYARRKIRCRRSGQMNCKTQFSNELKNSHRENSIYPVGEERRRRYQIVASVTHGVCVSVTLNLF